MPPIGDFWDDDCDYYPVRKFPESRPCHGRQEIQRFLSEYARAWEGYEFVVKELRAVGDDRVFVHGHIRAVGRESGVVLEGDLYQCFWVRNGKVFRREDHLTERGARRALGLGNDSAQPVRAGDRAGG